MDLFKIEIELDKGAALEDDRDYELALILRKLADEVEEGNLERVLRDSNGNRVGLSYFD